jgi:ribonuclease-3
MKNELSFLDLAIDEKRFKKWEQSLTKLETKINYTFKNKELLKDALKHRSLFPEQTTTPIASERMEFLGDSVLNLIVSEFLYRKFPEKDEGSLSKIKAKIVSKSFLYQKAQELGLSKYILVNNSEKKLKIESGVSINADIMESLIAAIYLDSSLLQTQFIVTNLLLNNLKDDLKDEQFQNYKSQLQEWSQARNGNIPEYVVTQETGPDHNKKFYVEVNIDNLYKAKGKGKSKRTAEQDAAKNLLKDIRKRK